MRRKLLEGLLLKKSLLPNDYQEVKYIESTGTQYIDTGVIWYRDYKVKTKLSMSELYGTLFGITSTDNKLNRIFYYDAISKLSYQGTGADNNIYPLYDPVVDEILDIDVLPSSRAIVNNQQTNISYTSVATRNCYIFGLLNNTGTEVIGYSKLKLYNFSMYDSNNTLIRNFIPCYRKIDNVAGLYDTVNDVFYTNAGSGTFTKGSNIE